MLFDALGLHAPKRACRTDRRATRLMARGPVPALVHWRSVMIAFFGRAARQVEYFAGSFTKKSLNDFRYRNQ
jgi:hypothetical protein